MPTHLACPHCQTLLQVPEQSGGGRTKCPGCGDDFVIPGSGTIESATPVCAVLAPVEGTATEADLARARAVLEQAVARTASLDVELSRRRRHADRLAVRQNWCERFAATRRRLDETIGRGGGFFVAITLGGALAIVLASVLPLSAFGHFFAAVLGIVITMSLYIPCSYYPDDERLAALIPRLSERAAAARAVHDQLAGEVDEQRAQLAAAQDDHERIKAAVASRLHWLRTCQWSQMTGRNFVNFLTMVFEEHGYQVEPTGKKGQVGVDLIVTRDGLRIAVTAQPARKGDIEEPLIRQAHAGRSTYDCQRAVVVGGGKISPAARGLAEQLGCQTIDGGQIPDLIAGRIEIAPTARTRDPRTN